MLDFSRCPRDRVKSDFLEDWNGWKPSWASDSHTIGSRIVEQFVLPHLSIGRRGPAPKLGLF
ncbi:MAG: hypothetical protein ACJ8AW_14850, partial [Rhodopila sp.]